MLLKVFLVSLAVQNWKTLNQLENTKKKSVKHEAGTWELLLINQWWWVLHPGFWIKLHTLPLHLSKYSFMSQAVNSSCDHICRVLTHPSSTLLCCQTYPELQNRTLRRGHSVLTRPHANEPRGSLVSHGRERDITPCPVMRIGQARGGNPTH